MAKAQSWQCCTIFESLGAEREAEWLCFCCHDSLITPNGLTICCSFSSVPWHADMLEATIWKAKDRSVLRNVQNKISHCTKTFDSSGSFISIFWKQLPFLNQVLPWPLHGLKKVDADGNHRCGQTSLAVVSPEVTWPLSYNRWHLVFTMASTFQKDSN